MDSNGRAEQYNSIGQMGLEPSQQTQNGPNQNQVGRPDFEHEIQGQDILLNPAMVSLHHQQQSLNQSQIAQQLATTQKNIYGSSIVQNMDCLHVDGQAQSTMLGASISPLLHKMTMMQARQDGYQNNGEVQGDGSDVGMIKSTNENIRNTFQSNSEMTRNYMHGQLHQQQQPQLQGQAQSNNMILDQRQYVGDGGQARSPRQELHINQMHLPQNKPFDQFQQQPSSYPLNQENQKLLQTLENLNLQSAPISQFQNQNQGSGYQKQQEQLNQELNQPTLYYQQSPNLVQAQQNPNIQQNQSIFFHQYDNDNSTAQKVFHKEEAKFQNDGKQSIFETPSKDYQNSYKLSEQQQMTSPILENREQPLSYFNKHNNEYSTIFSQDDQLYYLNHQIQKHQQTEQLKPAMRQMSENIDYANPNNNGNQKLIYLDEMVDNVHKISDRQSCQINMINNQIENVLEDVEPEENFKSESYNITQSVDIERSENNSQIRATLFERGKSVEQSQTADANEQLIIKPANQICRETNSQGRNQKMCVSKLDHENMQVRKTSFSNIEQQNTYQKRIHEMNQYQQQFQNQFGQQNVLNVGNREQQALYQNYAGPMDANEYMARQDKFLNQNKSHLDQEKTSKEQNQFQKNQLFLNNLHFGPNNDQFQADIQYQNDQNPQNNQKYFGEEVQQQEQTNISISDRKANAPQKQEIGSGSIFSSPIQLLHNEPQQQMNVPQPGQHSQQRDQPNYGDGYSIQQLQQNQQFLLKMVNEKRYGQNQSYFNKQPNSNFPAAGSIPQHKQQEFYQREFKPNLAYGEDQNQQRLPYGHMGQRFTNPTTNQIPMKHGSNQLAGNQMQFPNANNQIYYQPKQPISVSEENSTQPVTTESQAYMSAYFTPDDANIWKANSMNQFQGRGFMNLQKSTNNGIDQQSNFNQDAPKYSFQMIHSINQGQPQFRQQENYYGQINDSKSYDAQQEHHFTPYEQAKVFNPSYNMDHGLNSMDKQVFHPTQEQVYNQQLLEQRDFSYPKYSNNNQEPYQYMSGKFVTPNTGRRKVKGQEIDYQQHKGNNSSKVSIRGQQHSDTGINEPFKLTEQSSAIYKRDIVGMEQDIQHDIKSKNSIMNKNSQDALLYRQKGVYNKNQSDGPQNDRKPFRMTKSEYSSQINEAYGCHISSIDQTDDKNEKNIIAGTVSSGTRAGKNSFKTNGKSSGSNVGGGGQSKSTKSGQQTVGNNSHSSNQSQDELISFIQTEIKKAKKNPDLEYKVLKGKIFELAVKKVGSKFLQDHLKVASQSLINKIIEEIDGRIPEFMMDNYSNYFCSELIRYTQVHQRIHILEQLKGKCFVEISCNKHGTRALQNLIYSITQEKEYEIIKETLLQDNHILELSMNKEGHHMIEKIIMTFGEERLHYLFEEICKNYKMLAQDQQGLCVMKRLIEYTQKESSQKIIVENILCNVKEYVQNEFGNFIVSEVLTQFDYSLCSEIFYQMKSHFVQLSQFKYSSKFIEVCFNMAPLKIQDEIIEEFCLSQDLYKVVQCNFGNYVLQNSIEHYCKNASQRYKIIKNIIGCLQKVTDYKLQTRWGKEILERFIAKPANVGQGNEHHDLRHQLDRKMEEIDQTHKLLKQQQAQDHQRNYEQASQSSRGNKKSNEGQQKTSHGQKSNKSYGKPNNNKNQGKTNQSQYESYEDQQYKPQQSHRQDKPRRASDTDQILHQQQQQYDQQVHMGGSQKGRGGYNQRAYDGANENQYYETQASQRNFEHGAGGKGKCHDPQGRGKGQKFGHQAKKREPQKQEIYAVLKRENIIFDNPQNPARHVMEQNYEEAKLPDEGQYAPAQPEQERQQSRNQGLARQSESLVQLQQSSSGGTSDFERKDSDLPREN